MNDLVSTSGTVPLQQVDSTFTSVRTSAATCAHTSRSSSEVHTILHLLQQSLCGEIVTQLELDARLIDHHRPSH
jgi:hypothetical protein